MITPSFGLTATERVLPRLALDFTTASLDPRITFTRTGNTATRVNSSGLVELVNADIARFDFNPVTLACKGLLIEEARTNLITYSDDFRNTADAGSTRPWSYANVTLSADQIVSPDGTQNADQLVETTVNSGHAIQQSPTIADNTIYTNSVYAKKGSKSIFMLAIITKAGGQRGRLFDLNSGTSSALTASGWTTAPTGFGIEDAGNGWYRCWVSNDVGTGVNTNNFRIYMVQDAATVNFAGSTDNNIYIWGAQTELGAFFTSYIPTVASQVTRTADVATMTGTNFSDWYNQTEGTVVADYTCNIVKNVGTLTGYVWCIADGVSASTSSLIALQARARINQVYGWYSTAGGGVDESIILDTTTDSGKVSMGFKPTNKVVGSANALTPVTGVTNQQAMTATLMAIGSINDGTNRLNGTIRKLFYYPQKLTNNEIQAFSK